MEINIPTYDEISEKREAGDELTPLEVFVYENEPANCAAEAAFRSQLQGLVNYIAGGGR